MNMYTISVKELKQGMKDRKYQYFLAQLSEEERDRRVRRDRTWAALLRLLGVFKFTGAATSVVVAFGLVASTAIYG